MTDERFEEYLREAAPDYRRPPETPREVMWRQIDAARRERRGVRSFPARPRPWLRWGVGIAALLALGVALGRWSATNGGDPDQPGVTIAADRPAETNEAVGVAYRVATVEHLSRTEALLTDFRAGGATDERLTTWARDLLSTTRLLLDSPAGDDLEIRRLLEDLELVLAQIATLSDRGEDRELIDQGLDRNGVLLKLRTVVPSGPAAET